MLHNLLVTCKSLSWFVMSENCDFIYLRCIITQNNTARFRFSNFVIKEEELDWSERVLNVK